VPQFEGAVEPLYSGTPKSGQTLNDDHSAGNGALFACG